MFNILKSYFVIVFRPKQRQTNDGNILDVHDDTKQEEIHREERESM